MQKKVISYILYHGLFCFLIFPTLINCETTAENLSRNYKNRGEKISDPVDQSTPRKAWEAFRISIERDDIDGIWNYMSENSKKWLLSGKHKKMFENLKSLPDDSLKELAVAVNSSPSKLKAMNTKELARVLIFAEAKKNRVKIFGSKWKRAKVTGAKAIITTITPDGKEERAALVREEHAWKFNGPATKELSQK